MKLIVILLLASVSAFAQNDSAFRVEPSRYSYYIHLETGDTLATIDQTDRRKSIYRQGYVDAIEKEQRQMRQNYLQQLTDIQQSSRAVRIAQLNVSRSANRVIKAQEGVIRTQDAKIEILEQMIRIYKRTLKAKP